jgi:hypothetical protein
MALARDHSSLFRSPPSFRPPIESNPFQIDDHGDTSLHRIIRASPQKKMVLDFISLDIKRATLMSKIPNNEGYLPYDLIRQSNLADADRQPLKNHLLSMMISQRHFMKTTEILDFIDVQQRYLIPDHSELYRNLGVAVQTANEVRSLIWKSSTHPQANAFTTAEWVTVGKALSQAGRSFFGRSSAQGFQFIVDTTKQTHIGNCAEYVLLALDYLSEQGYKGHADVVSVVNGDHVILVIGKNTDISIENYKDWGPDCVICDAWAGAVYPASDIENRLQCYRPYYADEPMSLHTKVVRVITTFNPHFHKLESTQFRHIEIPTFS